ncbi:MAG: LacI family DNA-binding transcriptional regulator [Actinomyces sp.]|uniref:LacI family DNA-binding transcriptional regulator n=1 Tax=Actinomyces sp. TaxID=29317 RepID=UPI0026DD8246|nr:LacI family DNA-binding transcriptional regulator [Actinomyces sp.]MDO4242486.1 LacI family DNA-binding transcriptional regulator [Actinomyces sp.]
MPGSRAPETGGGPRRVAQADVAREAGVSRGLVSLTLSGSGQVSAASRERIRQAAQRLGYRVNTSAASLASGRSGLVGLVLPDLRNPFFDFLAQALQGAAREHGLTMLIILSPGDDEGRAAVDALVGMRVEGLVLVSPAMGAPAIRALGRDTPVCLVGRMDVGGAIDTVRLDEAAAATVVVDHLAAAGAQRLVYVAPPSVQDTNAAERGGALARAADEAGMPFYVVVDGTDRTDGTPDPDSTQRTDGAAARGGGTDSPLRRALVAARAAGAGRTGVVVHNDVIALDALAVLAGLGGRVPLVSYDDTFLARREEFSLASVEQPVAAMARDAIGFLCQRSGRDPVAGLSAAQALAMPARNVTVWPRCWRSGALRRPRVPDRRSQSPAAARRRLPADISSPSTLP